MELGKRSHKDHNSAKTTEMEESQPILSFSICLKKSDLCKTIIRLLVSCITDSYSLGDDFGVQTSNISSLQQGLSQEDSLLIGHSKPVKKLKKRASSKKIGDRVNLD